MSTILEYHAKGDYDLSTNFIYGLQKSYLGDTTKGMYLRDACKIATELGDTLLEDCPGNTEIPECYAPAEQAMANEEIMKKAADFRTKSYYKCNNVEDIKYALVHYGPILASIKWLNDLKVVNGVLTKGTSTQGGYHAIVIYGYNEQGFLCQNSWGKYWGNKGRFILPYDFKINEARGLIDLENDTYIAPSKKKKWINTLYKFFNYIVNFFIKIFTRE